MWYVKNVQKAASKAYDSANNNIKRLASNISVPNVDLSKFNAPKINILSSSKNQTQNQVEKAIKQICKNKKQIMPTIKLSKVADMSYQIQKFEQILKVVDKKLQGWKYNLKKAKQILNILVLVCYLIKHGASGFIDQFRDNISVFQSFKQIKIQNCFIEDEQQKSKLNVLIGQVKERTKYIVFLLTDKRKLLKEKELAMIIKQKILTGEKDKFSKQNKSINITSNSQKFNDEENKSKSEKVDSFLEHYVWKYWNKFDQKMQILADKIIQKIDEYIDIEEPQPFQIDQLQQQNSMSEAKQAKANRILQKQVQFSKQKVVQNKDRSQKLIDLDIGATNKQQKPVLNVQLI